MPIWIFSLVLYFKMLDELEKVQNSLEYWKLNIVKKIIEKTLELGEIVVHGSSSKYFFSENFCKNLWEAVLPMCKNLWSCVYFIKKK